MTHDDDGVGHAQGLFLVVGDEDKGDACVFLDLFQLLLHILAQLQVQRAQGFVQQQDLWLIDQRPGDGHPLLLAAGKACDPPVGKAREHDHVQHPVDAFLDLRLGDLALPQREGDVLKNVQMRKQSVFLEDRVDMPLMRRDIVDALAHKDDVPLVGRLEAADDAQGRRLAATGGAQQGDKFVVVNVQADAVQHWLPVEGFGDAF